MKPNVILMDEQLPHQAVQSARAAVRACDLLLVAGASQTVAPAGGLPALAVLAGSSAAQVNQTPAPLIDLLAVVVRGHGVEAVPALLDGLCSRPAA